MSELSKTKFPTVITTQDILGIEEGTMLKFDWASGKYVSVTESEDVSKDGYYYSGYAIALDPYLVKDNIGSSFSYIEEDQSEVDQSNETLQHTVTKEDVELNDNDPAIVEGEEIGIPKENMEPSETHTLVVDCSCGHRSVLGSIDAPGVSLTIMANDESNFLELTCPECKNSMRLWFAPEGENNVLEDERTEEESK